MGPFHWVVETGDLGEGTECYFGYVISQLPVRHPRRFQAHLESGKSINPWTVG